MMDVIIAAELGFIAWIVLGIFIFGITVKVK